MKSGMRETCSKGWNVTTDSSSLDVRNRDEFERFRLEGRSPMPAVNIPYFEMLELGGKDEMLDSVVAYVERDLARQLPSDLPILAVCAKGRHFGVRCARAAPPGVRQRQPQGWDESLG